MSDDVERESLRLPAFCPICEFYLRDHRTYWTWGCCELCFIEFVEDREQRWRDGWRPSAEEIAVRRHP